MSQNGLERAQTLLTELIEAARKGAIIPVRLTGQLEEVQKALDEAATAESESAVPASLDEYMKEQAKFISIAIHELRTPMTSIRGYTDMLSNPSMGTLNDMQKQFIETVRTNARRMEGLLTDVSTMSKLRAGTLRVTPKMDMFKNIAMVVEKATRPQAETMGRTLNFETPQGLPLLNVDGELLAQALVKLVENGLRYTRENGVVTVRAWGENGRLFGAIQDNGIGMTPEELAQLGTVYFRSENEYVRSYKGSGLGIPVAFGIIRALGGTVDVTSEPDKGTTITFSLMGMT